ncbi:hypothetical protein [Aphanizomenon sp. UHCC 0183]|uniref:hypothetical protein n=1 Tax=Aphanizomenon sp. UHCC 0183 TaxID=2590028 RepID=UPI001445998E|nr:hypothetical protein [Aphanizomenon sp. UHCC 0183]
MRLFTNKSLLSKAKFMWKTLVVLLLSALLFLPTPVLALNYNGTVQSYVSNAKVELDGVLTAIKKLPNLSYENGKTTLAEIDSKLQKIKTDAGKNTADFQKLSNEVEKEYVYLLDNINKVYSKQEYLKKQARDKRREALIQFGLPQQFWNMVDLDKPGSLAFVLGVSEGVSESDPAFLIQKELNQLESSLRTVKENQTKLEGDKDRLANAILVANKLSKFSDNLEKRVNGAREKFSNVKDYADVLQSFSDPDILNEISELNQMVANLTKDI